MNAKLTPHECLKILESMIEHPYTITPDENQVYALDVATMAMVKYHCHPREIAIIRYHVLNPMAIICRDAYSMRALREAAAAVKRLYKEEWKNDRQ